MDAIKAVPSLLPMIKGKTGYRGEMDQGRNCPVVWGLRNWIQLAVLVLTLGLGLQFYLFVRQAAGGGTITIARPAGVEGFLPIGALMGWKHGQKN
jgi:hypothetical protein